MSFVDNVDDAEIILACTPFYNMPLIDYTPILDKAIEMNYDEIIQLLINRGAREKPKNIFHAVVKDNHLQIPPEELERLLVKQWIDLNEVDKIEYMHHNILTHILDVGPEKKLWDPREPFNREPEEKAEMIEKFDSWLNPKTGVMKATVNFNS